MDTNSVIAVLLFLGALVLVIYACRLLISDARQGFEISMGAEMFYSNLWTLAGIVAGAALMLGFGMGWLMLVACVVLFFVLARPVRRVIKALYLGIDMPVEEPGSPSGFAAMSRKARDRESK